MNQFKKNKLKYKETIKKIRKKFGLKNTKSYQEYLEIESEKQQDCLTKISKKSKIKKELIKKTKEKKRSNK